MSKEKIIHHPEIGEIRLVKSTRFRRLSLRMAPGKGIWVNIPMEFSYSDGEKLVAEQIEWLQKNRTKIQKKENLRTLFLPQTPFQTRYHKLLITPHPKQELSARLKEGVLEIHFPQAVPAESDEIQDFIRKSVIETLRREAKYYLPQRLRELATIHSFQYRKVSVRNAKTRWGSCSHDNSISLNIHLMRLPQILIDYVILHELCHTVEKNHSSSFWNLMQKVCPEVTSHRREMKQFSTTLF